MLICIKIFLEKKRVLLARLGMFQLEYKEVRDMSALVKRRDHALLITFRSFLNDYVNAEITNNMT